MVRQRSLARRAEGGGDDGRCPNQSTSTSTSPSRPPRPPHLRRTRSTASTLPVGRILLYVAGCLAVAFVAYMGRQGYLETRVSTPFPAPPVTVQSGPGTWRRFWGSYRPGVYFGLKTRSKADLLAGLMWFMPDKLSPGNLGFRHWCEQSDDLPRYGWTRHDGEGFGEQEILDRGAVIKTSFIKEGHGDVGGGHWTARIEAEADPKATKKSQAKTISLLFYLGMDEGGGPLSDLRVEMDPTTPNRIHYLRGRTDHLGKYEVRFVEDDREGGRKDAEHYYTLTDSSGGPHKFTDAVLSRLRVYQQQDPSSSTASSKPSMANSRVGLDSPADIGAMGAQGDIVVYQVTAELPLRLDVAFTSSSSSSATERQGEFAGEAYTRVLKERRAAFDKRFEETFGLTEKGYNSTAVAFARAALSNMLGGIGYFFGHSIVRSSTSSSASPVRYWDAPLFTAVPSRSFFPRGFLWDEGFHNLLISKWSPEISADILSHWLDLINVEGWIPREQILGLEARAKVPAEFVVQHNSNANPPTLLLTLHAMVSDPDLASQPWFADFLARAWSRLELWYSWFQDTQAGEVPGTYRWRGRNSTTRRELNPKTLTSGLDDFPRASHPTEDERHVDLRCWMALASRLMGHIAAIIGKEEQAARYRHTSAFLHDNSLLEATHWSEEHGAFLDWGLHTEGVRLERPPPQRTTHPPPRSGQPPPPPPQEKVRVETEAPRRQFVNQFGYVGLFPLLLQVLDPSSTRLGKVLSDLESPSAGLWTPYGLRSLSSDASLYLRRNTEHDPPYWRGAVWVNANYLAVRALAHYAYEEVGPHSKQAERVYKKLRKALVENVLREYLRTGYVWEQYDDRTGKGKGCRPFTGWSALVVLIMGEK